VMRGCVLLYSKELREAELLDDVEDTEENNDQRFAGEDYFPVEDDQLYDDGKYSD